MRQIKNFLRKIIPRPLMNSYHFIVAATMALRYGFPSRKMAIIGVTGSKGKSTVSNMIWAVLSASGAKVGQTGTANFRISEKEYLNPYHMTMPGPAILQDWLVRMSQAGCKYAVIETPSEAQVQFRHLGINYDILIQTNITNELVAAHKFNLDTLIADNAKVYTRLGRSNHKMIEGVKLKKTIITGADDSQNNYYATFSADQKLTFGMQNKADYQASKIDLAPDGTSFEVDGERYKISLLGNINVINATAAIALGRTLGLSPRTIQHGFDQLKIVPGRMERIDAGQKYSVFVDYAHEQEGLRAVLETARAVTSKSGRVIVLTGGQGGGRDSAKRPLMGKIAAELADIVIISNEDPFDDDPQVIIDDIAAGAKKAGKSAKNGLYTILDRRAGIKKALTLAKPADIVLITGKGSEQSLIEKGRKIPWDDRKIVRNLLKQELKNATK